MAITVDSISPTVVESEGGRLLVVTGTGFELLKTYNVHVGAAGDATDPACYAGQGKGINITPKSVTSLECFLPELPTGTLLDVFGVKSDDAGTNDLLADAVTVIEPQESSSRFSMRRLFAPNRRVGKRTYDLFPAVDPPKQFLIETADLTDVAWTQRQISIVIGQEDAFGGTSGFTIHEDGTGPAIHDVVQLLGLPTPALIAGQRYTISVYAKAINRNWMVLDVDDGSETFAHTFDVSNGVVGQFLAGTGFVRIKAVDLVTGWFRVEMTFTPANSNAYSFAFGVAESSSSASFTGTDQDSILLSFPAVDKYVLGRAYRATGATVAT